MTTRHDAHLASARKYKRDTLRARGYDVSESVNDHELDDLFHRINMRRDGGAKDAEGSGAEPSAAQRAYAAAYPDGSWAELEPDVREVIEKVVAELGSGASEEPAPERADGCLVFDEDKIRRDNANTVHRAGWAKQAGR